MRFFVLTDGSNGITDFFHAIKLTMYEKKEIWDKVGDVSISSCDSMTRQQVEHLAEEISKSIREHDSEVLIGTAIIGLPYHFLNRNGIILCESNEISQRLFEEIYEDFYNNIATEENEEIEQISPYPVCIAEDGFYFFDFDKAMKAHPNLSSKKMLIPFLDGELYTSLLIRCSHIMPWLDAYVQQHGLSMEVKREDDVYVVDIMHGLCKERILC
ncbi:Fe-only nitrogenase accessory AnfO family protein [Anaerosporobacter sp.]|uniref:Fe-only nitrogenase accessory AnfO family protein n=1 Tax=Anaerosporobacter sp. TaxID=1872529 RepID=UPI00286EC5EC|nr:Fe-only nitrogenase accessory AnfO family protein [Anaerosporobacter sp.]